MNLDIIRWNEDEFGTFGIIRYKQRLLSYSLELPDRDNKPFVSRINCGSYRAEIVKFRKKYDAVYLHNVPGRTGILIHIANRIDEIQGCIAPGEMIRFEKNNEKIILNSAKALKKIVKKIKHDKNLIVRVMET